MTPIDGIQSDLEGRGREGEGEEETACEEDQVVLVPERSEREEKKKSMKVPSNQKRVPVLDHFAL